MKHRRLADIREDIAFQQRNLQLFEKWPVTIADSKRRILELEAELAVVTAYWNARPGAVKVPEHPAMKP